jgi:hypothetical protein
MQTKRTMQWLLLILMTLSMINCTVHHTHHHTTKVKKMPPGQAKKISGEKSAKKHAPGHNK